VILLSFVAVYLMQHNYVMRISFEKEKLEKKLSEVKRENELLEIEASRKTGLAQIDRYAHSRLAMDKPEQIEFIIVEEK
jgi:cell division protein FtsL